MSKEKTMTNDFAILYKKIKDLLTEIISGIDVTGGKVQSAITNYEVAVLQLQFLLA